MNLLGSSWIRLYFQIHTLNEYADDDYRKSPLSCWPGDGKWALIGFKLGALSVTVRRGCRTKAFVTGGRDEDGMMTDYSKYYWLFIIDNLEYEGE